jgi:hypothetical protein
MGLFKPIKQDCFCAFCKSQRKVYVKKRISAINVFSSALVAGIVTVAIFHAWDPRFFLFFVLFLAISETFLQVRWRISMVCKHCGFDPVLYVKDTQKAAEKVKIRLDQRKSDPVTMLAEPLKIPVIRKKGRTLNKQV